MSQRTHTEGEPVIDNPRVLLQDCNGQLFNWLAGRLNARQILHQVCEELAWERTVALYEAIDRHPGFTREGAHRHFAHLARRSD